MCYLIEITPALEGDRTVVPPYQYQVEAYAAHTAVHRAMMRFHHGPGRTLMCQSVIVSVRLCRHNEDE